MTGISGDVLFRILNDKEKLYIVWYSTYIYMLLIYHLTAFNRKLYISLLFY